MAWVIADEFIDLAGTKHTVIFRNSDTGAEHHLIHDLRLPVCPHCGRANANSEAEPADFHKVKTDELARLNDHHKKILAYREKHPSVRLGNAPKN